MEKNILSEEIRKIYSLMGIKKSLLNEADEDLGIETPSQTKTPKGKSSDPMGSFNFGAFGPIYYVKNGFKPFYLKNPVDISKILVRTIMGLLKNLKKNLGPKQMLLL